MSRLDRLFTLLSTSSSASARNLAAQQLGEVQRTYPDELHSLLTRLHPLIRSKRWEARIAAAAALTAILKELPKFDPMAVKEEDFEMKVGDYEVPDFNMDDIIGQGVALLNGSEGVEYETAGSSATAEEQKKRLNAEMGLDMAAKFGICPELVDVEDLQEDKKLSARERNVRKRQKRKQAKDLDESSKKMKIAALVYSINEAEKESLAVDKWPLEIFTQYLRRDLKSSNWEERHGAATALREIILLHGKSAGKSKDLTHSQMQQQHILWLHDLALELLTVLARDRFGDFVSDQVVAPVRETTAMALGNLMKIMDHPKQLTKVINVLLELTNQSDWECRHGAFLGMK